MCDDKVWFMNDQHLKSFWRHHQAALRWFKAHQAAREYAMNDSSDASSSAINVKSNINKRHTIRNNRLRNKSVFLSNYKLMHYIYQLGYFFR